MRGSRLSQRRDELHKVRGNAQQLSAMGKAKLTDGRRSFTRLIKKALTCELGPLRPDPFREIQ